MDFVVGDFVRQGFGFTNPNHAAAAICALFPLCCGWMRYMWLGRVMFVLLCVMLALTQSRTGLIVLVLEMSAWWFFKSRNCRTGLSKHWGWYAFSILIACFMIWWIAPRLSLDDSILNRPRIWLAGLQLFSANPSGVGLGNSGAIASAFLLPDIPEVRTMINAHITLLAEFGWVVGLVWFAFVAMALMALRSSLRIGIAFLSLLISACASTIFDWAVLFDTAGYGGLGVLNWILSWLMFAVFLLCGVWLIAKRIFARKFAFWKDAAGAVAIAGALISAVLFVPCSNAPKVENGFVFRGETSRTMILYDDEWRLRTALKEEHGAVILPVKPILRYPVNIDLSDVSKVVLLGNCREWRHLVKGVLVVCPES